MLREWRFPEAVAALAANAKANPASANAADSLGEAYAASGDRTNAIASYRRALLDPKLESSRSPLTRLTAPQ
jgi:cytochrome c-type biogenesis protein CcmH/NrfG